MACCGVFIVSAAIARADGDFRPLFDGESLDGWEGDSSLWSVEDGTIAGIDRAEDAHA